MILYLSSFVLVLIIQKLSNECFLAVIVNLVKDLVDDDQEDLNVLSVVGTVFEDLFDGNQEDTNKWFKCNDANVMTSITVTSSDEKFDQ